MHYCEQLHSLHYIAITKFIKAIFWSKFFSFRWFTILHENHTELLDLSFKIHFSSQFLQKAFLD